MVYRKALFLGISYFIDHIYETIKFTIYDDLGAPLAALGSGCPLILLGGALKEILYRKNAFAPPAVYPLPSLARATRKAKVTVDCFSMDKY